jgi:hypothetical protein
MKILVIDQCSSTKTHPEQAHVCTTEELDTHELDVLRERAGATRKARELYDGRQQQFITDAVDQLRIKTDDTVDRYFISAGFGLVEETTHLPPYEATFTDCSPETTRERARALGIESDLLAVLEQSYDLVFFALGVDYYRTFDVESVLRATPPETWSVLFNKPSKVEPLDDAISLPARTEDAERHGTIVVALKGVYLQNFARHRAVGNSVRKLHDVEEFCLQPPTSQTGLSDYN